MGLMTNFLKVTVLSGRILTFKKDFDLPSEGTLTFASF
jgi:hypothetical protein